MSTLDTNLRDRGKDRSRTGRTFVRVPGVVPPSLEEAKRGTLVVEEVGESLIISIRRKGKTIQNYSFHMHRSIEYIEQCLREGENSLLALGFAFEEVSSALRAHKAPK